MSRGSFFVKILLSFNTYFIGIWIYNIKKTFYSELFYQKIINNIHYINI
jgi:hypothetical protein